ncbi:MAG TPA: FHA domain-containing protein, partial [Polyangiaceae bacterium]|nr:FHA domain-containing protein [Polyangiaceae bacterium]
MASLTIEVLSGVSAGRVFESDADLIRVGRAPGSDLELPEPHVSAEHARLLVGTAEVVLEDLESTNGTWVEREGTRFHLSSQAARCILADGDVLELGGRGAEGTRLRLRVQPDRERGQLLELRPMAELGNDTRGVVDAERLRALIEALQRIGAAGTLQEAAGALAAAALDLVPRATHAAVMLRDDAVAPSETVTHGQVPVAFRVRSGDQVLTPGEPFVVPRSIVRKVVRERARVVIADAPSEAMSSESLLGASIYSTIGTPLFK